MRLPGRVPPPAVVAATASVVFLALAVVVGLLSGPPAGSPDRAGASPAAIHGGGPGKAVPARVRRAVPAIDTRPVPAAPALAGGAWSGFAFDACRAPGQRVMDRWRVSSPFSGVGIYLGGIHRACEQRHLTPAWVSRQLRTGWKLLPIWVGPQASCTGYDHRIDGRPGTFARYGAARARGVREARLAVTAARRLGLPKGETVFYDIEPFDVRIARCKWSSLVFLDAWTREIHARGYRSGVYSHVNSAIALLAQAGRRYARPDAVWYAWIDRVGTMPTKYVADTAFMRTSRVHQYVLDQRVVFGGVGMDIDWNFVSLGQSGRPLAAAGCDDQASMARTRPLKQGASGALVRVLQCLVLPGKRHPVKTTGRLDGPTVRAVRRFQAARGLRATGAVDRPTWTALLARGPAPALRTGARGEPVRRLQRSLNAALGKSKVRVDGVYGVGTARVVARYRHRVGLGGRGIVGPGVWKALGRGKVVHGKRR